MPARRLLRRVFGESRTSEIRDYFAPLFPLLGIILLVASVLKGYQLATEPVPEADLFTSRWFLASVVEFELFFSLWLLSGLYLRATRVAALTCFLAFAGVSLYQGLSGQASCGCFGKIPVSPWYMFVFDVIALAALWFSRPGESWSPTLRSHPVRFATILGIWILAGAGAARAMMSFTPTMLTAEGSFSGESQIVVLEPETWKGERFPLLKHVESGEEFSRGSWTVLLYHHNCSVCKELIGEYHRQARASLGKSSAIRIGMIEIPPYGDSSLHSQAGGSTFRYTRLSEAKEWFVKTPVVVQLEGGQVVSVTRPAAEAPSPVSDATVSLAFSSPALSKVISSPDDFRRTRRLRVLKQTACGPLALITLLHELGVALSDTEIDTLIAAAQAKGVDLLQLKELAARHGIHTLGVELSAAKLRELGLPAIALLNGVEFVAVTDYRPGSFRVVAPLAQPHWMPEKRFSSFFGPVGRALLLSKDPLNTSVLGLAGPAEPERPKTGPRLSLAKGVLAVGRILTHDWEQTLTLRNEGNEALEIKDIQSSCICMKPTLDKPVLEPGGSAVLRVKGTQKDSGPFAYHLLIQTNHTTSPAVKLPVRGYLDHPLYLEKPAELLENLLPDTCVERRIGLDLADGLDPMKVKVSIPEGAPLTANVSQDADGLAFLSVSWHGRVQPGWHHHRIDLHYSDLPGHPAMFLQLGAHVLPLLEASPPSLFITDKELDRIWSRRVVLQSRGVKVETLALSWSDSSCAGLLSVEKTVTENGLVVTVKANATGITTHLAGKRVELLIGSPSEPLCKVPLFLGRNSFVSVNGKESVGRPD